MVYCGKPSKACLPCRKRKLLCDLRRDGCSQCSRAQLACTGYRDTTAIRIRDETTSVERKVVRRANADRATVQSLNLTLCYQAKEMFYQNYVVGGSQHYSFMSQYYHPAATYEHLNKSINAVSLAYLNHHKPSGTAQAEARLQYVDALRLTGKAIHDPELAAQDSTLLSILMLDLYEKITNKEANYDGPWAAHIKGALSLVKIRGDEQFNDPNSLSMLLRLSTNFLISCVASGSTIPPEIDVLRAAVTSPSTDPPDLKQRKSELMIECALLHSLIEHGILTHGEILQTATDLETQFSELSRLSASSSEYQTVFVEEKSAHHYENYHYQYDDEYMGHLWNVLRISRIILSEFILSYSPKSDNENLSGSNASINPEQQAVSTINQMAREVCATVPHYIGMLPSTCHKQHVSTTSTGGAGGTIIKQADAKHFGPCYRLLFPLYVSAASPAVSKSVREYIIKELHVMAGYHGMENALAVAQILESGNLRQPWTVYALLGSYAFLY